MGYEGRAIPWYEGVDAAFSASEERIRGRRDTQKRRITGLSRQYGRVGVAGWRLRSARVAWVSVAPAGSSGKVGDVSGVKAAKRCSAVAAGAPEPLTPSNPSFLPSFPPRTRAHTHIHTQSRPYGGRIFEKQATLCPLRPSTATLLGISLSRRGWKG